jgi:adenylate cyclase class IV
VPTNVEIKARVADPGRLRRAAEELSGGGPETLVQRDVFFAAPNGRLKLRIFPDGTGELIHYARRDSRAPKESFYSIAPVPDAEQLAATLGGALGVRGVVEKTRRLFLVGPARIHVDEVRGLGDFMEIEVVLPEDEARGSGGRSDRTSVDGRAMIRDLMTRLGVSEGDLLAKAYIDLIEAGSGSAEERF